MSQRKTYSVGNRYVISKQMKNILMQSIFNHSYLDLQIVVITDDTYLDDYKYAFSMGHFKDEEKVHNHFVHNTVTRDQYLNGFTQLLRMLDFGISLGIKGPLSVGIHGVQGNGQAAITDGTHSVVDIWKTSFEEYLGDGKSSSSLIEDLIKYIV